MPSLLCRRCWRRHGRDLRGDGRRWRVLDAIRRTDGDPDHLGADHLGADCASDTASHHLGPDHVTDDHPDYIRADYVADGLANRFGPDCEPDREPDRGTDGIPDHLEADRGTNAAANREPDHAADVLRPRPRRRWLLRGVNRQAVL